MSQYTFKTSAMWFYTKNCFSSDTNKGLGKKKTFITYSSPNSPLSRSNASPSFLPPLFLHPAPGHVLFLLAFLLNLLY